MSFKPRGKFFMVLALVLVAALLAACGGTASSSGSAPAAASSGAPASSQAESWQAPTEGSGGVPLPVSQEKVTYTFMTAEQQSMPFRDSFVVLPEIERLTNVAFELITVPDSQYNDKFSVTLASGDLPDYMANGGGISGIATANEYGPKGLFLNIWDYVDVMPNMKKGFETYDSWNAYKYSDSELYQLLVQCAPDSDPQGFGYYQQIPMIRTDLLEKHNLEIPETFDELYEVLLALKAEYPGSYPWVSSPESNSALFPVIKQMLHPWNGDVFSYENGFTSYNHGDKSWYFAPERDGFKELVEYLTNAYADGIMDPEFLSSNSAQGEERILNDQSFFEYSYWNDSDYYTLLGRENGNPDFTLMGIKPPYKDGPSSVTVRPPCNNTNVINAKVENPEILLAALDFWLYSRDGTMIANAGIEGENYVWEDEHTYKLIDPDMENPTNETHKEKYGVRYGYMTGFRPDHLDLHGFVPDPDNNIYHQQYLIYQGLGVDPAPVVIFKDPEDSSQMKELSTPIRDYVEQHISKIISGAESIDSWDSMLDTARQMGSDKMVEILNRQ